MAGMIEENLVQIFELFNQTWIERVEYLNAVSQR